MAAVISFSILFNIPRYLDDHVVTKPDGSPAIAPTYIGSNGMFQIVYASFFYYIFTYFLPVIILAVMTYRHAILLLPSKLW